MGNCVLPCNSKLNEANKVKINENPEKSDTVGGTGYRKKKTKFPKKVILKDEDDEIDNKIEKLNKINRINE